MAALLEDILKDRAKLIPVLVVAVVIAVGAALVILLTGDDTGGGSAAGSSAGGSPSTIAVSDFMFDPDPASVPVGTKVTWTNQDSSNHTATADDGSFDTGNLRQGDTGSYTFAKAGEYSYLCEIHPFMKGTVVVK